MDVPALKKLVLNRDDKLVAGMGGVEGLAKALHSSSEDGLHASKVRVLWRDCRRSLPVPPPATDR